MQYFLMKKLVIALSGPPGSGTSTVGKVLARRLKLEYFSPGLYYRKIMKQRGVEKAPEFWKTKFGSSKELHEHVDQVQLEKARKGNIVVEGTLSIYFLKKIASHKVWLNVQLKVRAQRTAKKEKIPYQRALKEVKERQTMERKGWEKIYGFDYFNQKKDAGLILDSSNLTINQTVNKILDFIKRRQAFNS